jgi:hypothetical protein
MIACREARKAKDSIRFHSTKIPLKIFDCRRREVSNSDSYAKKNRKFFRAEGTSPPFQAFYI